LVDRLGALASFACAVHCVLTGVAIGFLSVAGLGFLAGPEADIAFLVAAVLIGGLAVWQGYRRHRSFLPASLYVGGLLLVIVGHFVIGHGDAGHGNRLVTSLLAAVGGLMLVVFHFVNMRLGHRCSVCHPGDGECTGPVRSAIEE
jgi:hypothetical protein